MNGVLGAATSATTAWFVTGRQVYIATYGGQPRPLRHQPALTTMHDGIATSGRDIIVWVSKIGGGPPADLWLSHDSGRRWHRAVDPCITATSEGFTGLNFSEAVSFDPAGGTWMLCGSEPGAGNQIKALRRSRDGGEHWAASMPLAEGGYVGELLPFSAHRAWVAFYRVGVLRTLDGGHSWRDVHPRDAAVPERGLAFAGPERAYLLSYRLPAEPIRDFGPLCVFATDDGGQHWLSYPLPPVPDS